MKSQLKPLKKFINKACKVQVDPEVADSQSSGEKYCALIIDFSALSEGELDTFNEIFEGHGFLEGLDEYTPFAVLIKDDEFSEEITLEDLEDYQLEGCLFLEKGTGIIFHSDEGTSNEFCPKLENLLITEFSGDEEE